MPEEKRVLSPFVKSASVSGVLVVSGIKLAYEKALGHQVPKSTVYRMLERHEWRKLAPRPSHPSADPEAQASDEICASGFLRKPLSVPS